MKLTATMRSLLSKLATAGTTRFNRKVYAGTWTHIRNYWTHEWNTVSHRRLGIATAVASLTMFGAAYTAIDKIQGTQSWDQVFTNGTYVGMVPNADSVTSSIKRIALGYHVDVRLIPVHTHVSEDYDWKSVAMLPISTAAITVNGQPVVYTSSVADGQQILNMLKTALAPKNLKDNAQVEFVDQVAVTPEVASVTNIMEPHAALRYLLQPASNIVASRAMSLSDLTFAPMSDKLNASHSQPLIQVATSQTATQTVLLPYKTNYVSDSTLGTGAVKVTSPGKPGVAREMVKLTYVNGTLLARTVLSKEVVQQPTDAVARKGTNPGVAVGSWGWPAGAYSVTSGYGWRWGGAEFHPGIDIGCPTGTPVYATNNGVVEDAGWNSGGYGIWIKINNGGGIETIFGHMSRVTVHAGQMVSKGQLIGYSGCTGEATGPHLHYEVRLNGSHINPRPYM